MQSNSVYRLARGVQVRSEVFGLLFYDYRGPRLYFVPSKDLLTDAFFDGRQSVGELLDHLCAQAPWPRKAVEETVGRLLETLEGKGLVHGQPLR